MKAVLKFWKVFLALILIGVAAFLYFDKYQGEKLKHEMEVKQLETMVMALQTKIQENKKYEGIQDQLEDAKAEIQASRMDLYESFPVEMREEDQIMYVLYLETLFKEEIFFSFNQPMGIAPLRDGSTLQGLMLTVNYKTTYKGFQEMIEYLSTDSRVASVYEATIDYDSQNDVAMGYLTLILYVLDTDSMEYLPPDVNIPDTGKENIFD